MKGVIPKEVLIHFVGDVPYVAQIRPVMQYVVVDFPTHRKVWMEREKLSPILEKALTIVQQIVEPAMVAQVLNTIMKETKDFHAAPTQEAATICDHLVKNLLGHLASKRAQWMEMLEMVLPKEIVVRITCAKPMGHAKLWEAGL